MWLGKVVSNCWTALWIGSLDWTPGLDHWTGLLDWITGLTFELNLCAPHDLHPIRCGELHAYCHKTKDGMQLWKFCTQQSLRGRPIVQCGWSCLVCQLALFLASCRSSILLHRLHPRLWGIACKSGKTMGNRKPLTSRLTLVF